MPHKINVGNNVFVKKMPDHIGSKCKIFVEKNIKVTMTDEGSYSPITDNYIDFMRI